MKKILLTAIAVYAVIIIAGATAYFLLRDPPVPPPARAEVTTSAAAHTGEMPDTDLSADYQLLNTIGIPQNCVFVSQHTFCLVPRAPPAC